MQEGLHRPALTGWEQAEVEAPSAVSTVRGAMAAAPALEEELAGLGQSTKVQSQRRRL